MSSLLCCFDTGFHCKAWSDESQYEHSYGVYYHEHSKKIVRSC